MTIELFESESGIANAAGRAEVSLQPLQAFHRWHVKRMTIHSSSTALVPTLKVYRGGESPGNMVDNSYTGTLDHSDTSLLMRNGERLLFVWEGCDVGASCTAVIEGEVLTS